MIHFDFLDGLYPSWHSRALCNGDDPALWFPSAAQMGNTVTRGDVTAEAIAVCARCPVRRQCAESRDAHRERYGIWAGVDLEAKEDTDAA